MQTHIRLDTLPTEVFHNILKHMAPISVLAMKFVSKSSYMKTKYPDGGEVVNIRAEARNHRLHTEFMVKLEADGMRAEDLKTLTCQNCGVQKANNCEGFDDEHFARCIECCTHYYAYPDRTFEVGRKTMFRCGAGGCVELVEKKASKKDQAELAQHMKKACWECLEKFARDGAPTALWYGADPGNVCKTCCEAEMERLERCRNTKCTNVPCVALSAEEQSNVDRS
jgi:hypothetical protein